jgi:hypothetical protein
MAKVVPHSFSERAARRIVAAVSEFEKLPRGLPEVMVPEREIDELGTFVIASDPSDYSEAEGLLPLGYRGHVIGYRLTDEFDLRKLKTVPSLDSLLKKASSATGGKYVANWADHQWTDQYSDDTLGRPVLLNVCRYARGAFFRGQVVTASYLPGFRCSDAWRGSHFGYAAPTWGEWPDENKAADPKFFAQPGWCVIDPGYTSLVVTLTSDLDPSDDDLPYATAGIKTQEDVAGADKQALLIPPDGTEEEDGPTAYVYLDEDDTSHLPAETTQTVQWDHFRFRWQARVPAAQDVAGPALVLKMTLDGEPIWASDWANGAGAVASSVNEIVYRNDWLIAAEDGSLGIYVMLDPESGEPVRRVLARSGDNTPRLDANTTYIAHAAGNSSFQVYDYDGLCIWDGTPNGVHRTTRGFRFGPDGYLYSFGQSISDQDIFVYDVVAQTLQRTITMATPVNGMDWDASGNLYLVLNSSAGDEVRVLDSADASVWNFEHGGNLLAIAVDPNSGDVLVGGSAGTGSVTLRLLDNSGAELWSKTNGTGSLVAGTATIRSVAFDEEGNCYATGDQVAYGDTAVLSIADGSSALTRIYTTRKFDHDGNLLWSFDFGANTTSIIIEGDYLYVSGTRSTLKMNPVF